jgi:hypothetical protein
MAAMVASVTPASAPRQPAWAAPTMRASGSANRTGPQSAVEMPIASPGRPVTMASARGRACASQGASATTTSGEWI